MKEEEKDVPGVRSQGGASQPDRHEKQERRIYKKEKKNEKKRKKRKVKKTLRPNADKEIKRNRLK